MRLGVLRYLAIVLIALALVPAGAHLLAVPNRIGRARRRAATAGRCWASSSSARSPHAWR